MAEAKQSYENETVILASYPSGDPTPENFKLAKSTISAADLGEGEILVKVISVSIDAYLRTTMWEPKPGQLHKTVAIGEALHSACLGQVVASNNEAFKVGGHAFGLMNITRYNKVPKSLIDARRMYPVASPTDNPDDIKYFMGILNPAGGCSAYAGAYYVTKEIKEGDIAVVNAASGQIGSLVCQMYRNRGAKVIGITGGADKKKYLVEELGVYKCINYKEEDVDAKLTEYAPDGFNVAWDNVGGPQLDLLLKHLSTGAQIVLCGAVSQYSEKERYGPKNYSQLVVKNASMNGFNVFPYFGKMKEMREELMKMVYSKKLVLQETGIKGLDNFCEAMNMLLKGNKKGKMVLYV